LCCVWDSLWRVLGSEVVLCVREFGVILGNDCVLCVGEIGAGLGVCVCAVCGRV